MTATEAPAVSETPVESPRRRRWIAAAAVIVAAAGAGTWYGLSRTGSDDGQHASGLPPATAAVTRQDLVESQQESGTLGYGTTYTLTGARPGVLTWLPEEGATVSRGQPLCKVDNVPVPLLYGSLPFYRPLNLAAADGPDVRELEQNLHALGYGGFTVDDHFTQNTADAVESWQHDEGLPETGALKIGDAVVAAGAIRVGESTAQVGAQSAPGKPIYSYSSTTRTVTVPLPVSDQELAKAGADVTVVLPDNTTIPGTIATVGTVAQKPSGDGSSTAEATITVTVTLDRPDAAGSLDQAPVEVNFVSEQVKNVLTVPITALLALSGGGYGVQVVDGGTSHVVAVKTGAFSDTRVQVSGAGLREGQKVGVPQS